MLVLQLTVDSLADGRYGTTSERITLLLHPAQILY